jgi:hypothetical protein
MCGERNISPLFLLKENQKADVMDVQLLKNLKMIKTLIFISFFTLSYTVP